MAGESAIQGNVTGILLFVTTLVVVAVLLLALGAWFGVSRRAVAAEARAVDTAAAPDEHSDLAA